MKHIFVALALSLVTSLSFAAPLPKTNAACSKALSTLGFNQIGTSDSVNGPIFEIQSVGEKRKIEEIQSLRIGSYNVENLFVRDRSLSRKETMLNFVYRGGQKVEFKPEAKIKAVADVILSQNPDIMVIVEVDDIRALTYLADTYLDGRYYPILIEGNDTRGIDIGFLVKKDLPFDMTLKSHKKLVNGVVTRVPKPDALVFSRDLPVLEIRPQGAKEKDSPLFAVAGTHYKSQAGGGGGLEKRTEQAKKTAQILSEYDDKKVAYMLMGDYNNDVPTSPEFKSLYDQGMKDAFDLRDPPLTGNDRVTHTYHPDGQPYEWNQIDAILLSKEAQKLNLVKDAKVVPYYDASGNIVPLPTTYQERSLQPSDHRMITTEISFQPLRK